MAEEKAPDCGREVNLTGKRILLAEDIEINRLILNELLADTGVVIDEAVDGEHLARHLRGLIQNPMIARRFGERSGIKP